jgi:hypothetical protein
MHARLVAEDQGGAGTDEAAPLGLAQRGGSARSGIGCCAVMALCLLPAGCHRPAAAEATRRGNFCIRKCSATEPFSAARSGGAFGTGSNGVNTDGTTQPRQSERLLPLRPPNGRGAAHCVPRASPGMRLGWPGFRPSLLPFWNFFAGLGLAIGFPCFPYFSVET